MGNWRRFLIFWLLFSFIVIALVYGESAKLIDLNFKNADIKDVFRALANQEGVSLLIDDNVGGAITVRLSKLTFQDALALLVKNNNLVCNFENRVYHISKADPALLKVNFGNNLLSVEAKDAKLSDVFDKISQQCRINLIPAPELQGDKINVLFNNAPVDDGITIILTQANCVAEKKGTAIYVRRKRTDGSQFSVTYQNNLLTLDAQNAPLAQLARELTEKTGNSVIPDQSLNVNVTVYFKSLPLSDGLAALCDANNLLFYQEGQVWRISRRNAAYRIKLKDNLLSVDADAVDIATLVNEINRQAGLNISLAREVRGPVTAHFQNLSLEQGLNVILESQGWLLEKQGKSYFIRVNNNANPNIRIFYDPKTALFDLDVQSAPVNTIISEMARRADLNVVVLAQVSWTINNLRLQDMNFEQILNFLLKGTVFNYKITNNAYLVGDTMIRPENTDFSVIKIYPVRYLKVDQLLATLPQSFPKQNFTPLTEKNAVILTGTQAVHQAFQDYLQQVDTENIQDLTEVIRIKHMKAEDVLKLIPPSISKSDVVVVKEMNALTVTGPQNLIEQIKKYIAKIDQVNPMIVFDIKVVSISDSNSLNWTPPGSLPINGNNQNLVYDLATGEVSIDTGTHRESITLLLKNGKAKLLQNPTISTLNGYQTSFKVDTKRVYNIPETTTSSSSSSVTPTPTPYTTYRQVTFDTGLTINITPWVSATNQITMDIEPSYSEFNEPTDPQMVGSTYERTIKTTMRVSNRQTVIISGLKNNSRTKNVSKIPVLGDIPLIGFLFRKVTYQESQDEFVIMITPYIVYDKNDDPEQTKEKYGPEIQAELTAPSPNSSKPSLSPAPSPNSTPLPKPTPTPTPSALSSPSATPGPSPTTKLPQTPGKK